MMSIALAIVWTTRACKLVANEVKRTKNVNIRADRVQAVHAEHTQKMLGLHGCPGLVWCDKNARITLVLPRTEPGKSQRRSHKKFGVIPFIFNQIRQFQKSALSARRALGRRDVYVPFYNILTLDPSGR